MIFVIISREATFPKQTLLDNFVLIQLSRSHTSPFPNKILT